MLLKEIKPRICAGKWADPQPKVNWVLPRGFGGHFDPRPHASHCAESQPRLPHFPNPISHSFLARLISLLRICHNTMLLFLLILMVLIGALFFLLVWLDFLCDYLIFWFDVVIYVELRDPWDGREEVVFFIFLFLFWSVWELLVLAFGVVGVGFRLIILVNFDLMGHWCHACRCV